MRLPSHLLALVGLAVGCEPAHEEPQCKSPRIEAVDDIEIATPTERPGAGPKVVPPQPPPQPTKPQPQPIVKKPQKRMVWASVCGHSQLVDEKAMLVKCGQG